MKKGMTSIVILSFNQVDFTKNCLESIRKYTDVPYEIVVIDNNSNQETIEYLDQQKDIVLVKNSENKGFAGGCNQGMEISKGEYILLLNNDTIVTKDYLKNMLTLLESDEEIGMVGPVTNNTIGRQKIDIELDYEDKESIHLFGEQQSRKEGCILTPRLIGFCMLFKKEFIDEIGMFDLSFKVGNYEDDDLCIRTLLAGKKLYICQNSFVYHYKRASFDNNNLPFEEISRKNKKVLEQKWNGLNWNHYAMTNSYIEEKLMEQKPKSLLHIGCGLGSLEIHLQNYFECHMVGIENHKTRREIAAKYLSEVYEWDEELNALNEIADKKFDVVVMEGGMEIAGESILARVKDLLNPGGVVFVRVFNGRHITTFEKLLTGSVWGDMICAVSPEFKYYYTYQQIIDVINRTSFSVGNQIEIKKTLSSKQQEIWESISSVGENLEEILIYNWIFELK